MSTIDLRMNLTLSPEVEVAAPNAELDFGDNDLKDIYWPDFDPLSGETPVAFKLRFTFTCAGYRTTRIEEVATHPVVVIRTVQPDTGRIANHQLLLQHVRDMLCQAGFHPKRDELTVDRSGHRLLIAFQSGKWVPNFEEILREPQDDLADYADVAP